MTIKVVTEFLQEGTIIVHAFIFDEDGAAVSPTTSTKLTVLKQDGTALVDAQDMTEDATGDFSYLIQTDSDTVVGRHKGKVVGIDGSGSTAKTSIGKFGFNLKAGIFKTS